MKTWQDWEEVHQPFELQYHIEHGIEWCSDESRFWNFWEDIFDFIGVQEPCLDVGCGPRPPFGPSSTAIDPLATHYRNLRPQWWEGVRSFDTPAETFHDLEPFQTVMCWNCLDHTIGWKDILKNLQRYVKGSGTLAIATDFKPPSIGHPGFDRDEFFQELERRFRIVKQIENFQDRDVAFVLRRR